MIIEVDESFKKDFRKLKNRKLEERIISKLDQVEASEKLVNISNIKLMKGFVNFYRLRIGDYRIGFRLEGDTVTLLRVRNRKDIYNIFP